MLYVQGKLGQMEYIGIDVSKAKFDCLWLRDVEALKVKNKGF